MLVREIDRLLAAGLNRRCDTGADFVGPQQDGAFNRSVLIQLSQSDLREPTTPSHLVISMR